MLVGLVRKMLEASGPKPFDARTSISSCSDGRGQQRPLFSTSMPSRSLRWGQVLAVAGLTIGILGLALSLSRLGPRLGITRLGFQA